MSKIRLGSNTAMSSRKYMEVDADERISAEAEANQCCTSTIVERQLLAESVEMHSST